MGTIPKEKPRGWTVTIDGEEQTVGRLEITSKFGTLSYGLRPEGYDSWVFHEAGEGGAVTIPFSFDATGKLLLGLILEKRSNMGDVPVWCIIGGFLDPEETHGECGSREATEEAGFDSTKTTRFDLMGLPTNSNRAFYVADASKDEGVHAAGLRIPFKNLVSVDNYYVLNDNSLLVPGFVKSNMVRFFHWREAILETPDALARSAISQLLATMLET